MEMCVRVRGRGGTNWYFEWNIWWISQLFEWKIDWTYTLFLLDVCVCVCMFWVGQAQLYKAYWPL